MIVAAAANQQYGYGLTQAQSKMPSSQEERAKSRQIYDTQLLAKVDDKAYKAFENATAHYEKEDKKMFAKALERTVARSAADNYALVHDVNKVNEIDVVYAFFETYHDVVSTEEIKHLLNVRLQTAGHPPYDQSKIENFFNDYFAQLGEPRQLDIFV